MYDAQVGRWWVIDPLAEKYYSFTPYNYVANSPMVLVDPNGSFIDNYVFDENGNFVRKEENNEPDKIIVENNKTGNVDAELEVGQDETLEENFFQEEGLTGFKNITNRDLAKNIFEFFAENTEVEWGWGIDPLDKSDIFTSNKFNKVQVSDIRMQCYESFTHNHPSGEPRPSGREDTKIVGGDLRNAKKYPEKNFYIYVNGNKNGYPKGYYKFTKDGMEANHIPDNYKGEVLYKPINLKF